MRFTDHQILAFLAHYYELLKRLDESHDAFRYALSLSERYPHKVCVEMMGCEVTFASFLTSNPELDTLVGPIRRLADGHVGNA